MNASDLHVRRQTRREQRRDNRTIIVHFKMEGVNSDLIAHKTSLIELLAYKLCIN